MGFPRQEYWSGLPFPIQGDSLLTENLTENSLLRCFNLLTLHPSLSPLEVFVKEIESYVP